MLVGDGVILEPGAVLHRIASEVLAAECGTGECLGTHEPCAAVNESKSWCQAQPTSLAMMLSGHAEAPQTFTEVSQ